MSSSFYIFIVFPIQNELTGETFKNVAVDFVLALNHLHIKFRKKLQKTNIKNCAHICKIAIEKLYRIDIFYYIKYTVNVLTLAHHQQPENTKTFDFDSNLQTQNICRVNKLPSILYF